MLVDLYQHAKIQAENLREIGIQHSKYADNKDFKSLQLKLYTYNKTDINDSNK
jgi:hypothetical protein